MAIPTSKPLSLSTVQGEYGGSNPINMSEYRGDGNAPASGPIDLWADFNGTSNTAQIELRVYGAAGGARYNSAGAGGYTQLILDVTPGVVFSLYAGGKGDDGSFSYGGAGGAASFVTAGSTLVAVAGGGGGGSNNSDGGGGNNSGQPVAYGGSSGNGGAANNDNARYFAQAGSDWTDSSKPGYGGDGGGYIYQSYVANPGLNPGNKGRGGYGRDASEANDAGGSGGGGGYGGGGGGCTEDDAGGSLAGGGGGGFAITNTNGVAGISLVSLSGTNGANAGQGYIQVYRDGSLVASVTSSSRSGASGTYTV